MLLNQTMMFKVHHVHVCIRVADSRAPTVPSQTSKRWEYLVCVRQREQRSLCGPSLSDLPGHATFMSADPGAAQQDVQQRSLEEAAEAAEEHGGAQSHAGPAASVLRPGQTSRWPLLTSNPQFVQIHLSTLG